MVKDGVQAAAPRCSFPTAAGAGSPAGASTPRRTPRPGGPRPANRPAERRGPGARRAWSAASPGSSSYQDEQVQRLKNAAIKNRSSDRLEAARRQPRRLRLHGAGRRRREERRRCCDFLYRDRTQLAVYSLAMYGLALEKQGEQDKLAMILRNIEPVRRAGRREPDGLAQPARRLLVVLVRQRVRGRRLLPEAAGPDRSEGRDGPAAGQVPAEQPQARHLLELDPRHGHVHRGDGRLPPGQRRGPARHDRRGLATTASCRRRSRSRPSNLFQFDNKFVLEGDAVDCRAGTRSNCKKKGTRAALLQRLPDQLHAGGLHHRGRPGDQGQPQVLQARQGRQDDQGGRLARAGRRPEGREVRAAGVAQPVGAQERRPGRDRAGRSRARTTTSTWSSRT